MLQDGLSKCVCLRLCAFVCVAHPLPGCDRPSCSAQEEEGDPRSKLQPEPATKKNTIILLFCCE